MTIDRSHIRVKAMLIAPNPQRTAHAVSVNGPTRENPEGYHRFVGGSVELGETHEAAIIREVDEELGATIDGLTYLGCVENIFHIDGELGHEIVFFYMGELNPLPPEDGATLTEIDGSVVPVVWRPIQTETPASPPLYPQGAQPYVDAVLRHN